MLKIHQYISPEKPKNEKKYHDMMFSFKVERNEKLTQAIPEKLKHRESRMDISYILN